MESGDSLWGQAVKLCMCESQYFYSSERFSKGSRKGKLQHLVFSLGENNRNISGLTLLFHAYRFNGL